MTTKTRSVLKKLMSQLSRKKSKKIEKKMNDEQTSYKHKYEYYITHFNGIESLVRDDGKKLYIHKEYDKKCRDGKIREVLHAINYYSKKNLYIEKEPIHTIEYNKVFIGHDVDLRNVGMKNFGYGSTLLVLKENKYYLIDAEKIVEFDKKKFEGDILDFISIMTPNDIPESIIITSSHIYNLNMMTGFEYKKDKGTNQLIKKLIKSKIPTDLIGTEKDDIYTLIYKDTNFSSLQLKPSFKSKVYKLFK
jgi:hypothetical protein